MATLTLRNVKNEQLTWVEMDANFTALNDDKLDVTDWPTFVGATSGNINATNVGGATATSVAHTAADLENLSDSTYMTSLLRTASSNDLSANQAGAIAAQLAVLQAQISLILSKLDSVA